VPLTTSAADVFYLTTPEEVELDSNQPVSDRDLVDELRACFDALPADKAHDVDVTGDDAFGV
jgi:hypothetical protein